MADEKLFLVIGEGPQFLEWDEYGFRMQVPEDATSGHCDIAVNVIIAGKFQFPEETELVSAVYAVSASRKLNKPVTVEIQHCVSIRHDQQGHFLGFVTAKCNQPNLPYTFELLEGGMFCSNSYYGNIACHGFSIFGVILYKLRLTKPACTSLALTLNAAAVHHRVSTDGSID